MQEIILEKKVYQFEPINLFYGRKEKTNKKILKENLKDLIKILETNQIKYNLIYGTLLGVIRENDIIEHDEDVDIMVMDEYRNKMLSILFELRKEELEVARYSDDLLSIIRNDEYIDIYFFKSKSFSRNIYCGNEILPKKLFKNLIRKECLDSIYYIPQRYEEILEYCYGKDWRIPKKNFPATNYSNLAKIKKKLMKKNPKIYNILKKWYNSYVK